MDIDCLSKNQNRSGGLHLFGLLFLVWYRIGCRRDICCLGSRCNLRYNFLWVSVTKKISLKTRNENVLSGAEDRRSSTEHCALLRKLAQAHTPFLQIVQQGCLVEEHKAAVVVDIIRILGLSWVDSIVWRLNHLTSLQPARSQRRKHCPRHKR